MADLPLVEEKIDLKDALDRLIKNKQDAVQTMIYVTLKWKLKDHEIASEIKRLQLKRQDKIIVVGRR